MAADRYLTLVGTTQALKSSNDTSSGAGDAGKIVALASTGKLDFTLFPTGIGETSITKTASEALAAGSIVSFETAGTMRLADASNQRRGDGFVLSAVANGATGTVFLSGLITGLSSLTPGAKLFVGAAGALTATAPTAANSIWQVVARAVDSTSAEFTYNDPILIQ